MTHRQLHLILLALACLATQIAVGQDRVCYTGTTLADPGSHDGRLSPVVGTHCIQTMRAHRRYDLYATNGNGWTYNHQPMMAYWHGKFYMHYLSDPVDEHVPPSRTMLQTSADGYEWSAPTTLFPIYPLPDGTTKGGDTTSQGLAAVMHQRVGFYVSQADRLIAMGHYGICLDPKDDPNDGNGIGRVVREISDDGTLGPIYFIYYNHGYGESNTAYPHYTRSRDKAFRQACDEILANPLYMMQWVEEADRDDPLIPLSKPYKAFCWYTLPDGRKAGLWKHALTSISDDGGHTWQEPVARARGFVNSNAKIWGQRLSNGTYATVYNPAEYRWPLAISLSGDGLHYNTLNVVHGVVPPMRYGGQYKSFGPQYVRGIQEGNGTPPDGHLWLTYSVNKEDLWVARIPVPVRTQATSHAAEDFAQYDSLSQLTMWNMYSCVWAPVSLHDKDGRRWLTLADKDPFDCARVERMIPASRELSVEFTLMAEQSDYGMMQVELLDAHGTACARLDLTPTGEMRSKGGARYGRVCLYEAGRAYRIRMDVSLSHRQCTVYVDGQKKSTRMLFAPVEAVERIAFCTGERTSLHPNVDTPADQQDDMPRANDADPLAIYRIADVRSSSSDADGQAAILRYDMFAHHIDYFNGMEDENVTQAIPNAQASEWMRRNVPLFACPHRDMEQMYYYRWWTLRKHIKHTPVGYAMTEFLVNRSYADQYNLIACAIGHHIYESRWLRQPEYLDGIVRTWYRGNGGKPMAKMMNFSSWNADALYGRYLVDGDTAFVADLYADLCAEYSRWEATHRLPSGLYWQGDVQDGMEESISGARGKRYARPTINSYMYGNAVALARMAATLGKADDERLYNAKADTLRRLVESRLWSDEHQFFETLRGDSLAMVREAIGYLPWYFGLPSSARYDVAWRQLDDERGFAAPYGLTTAERRHPQFRTHGVGRCEWDGAVWPFATSQTLTALARHINSAERPVATDSTFYRQMELYVEAQHHRGRPYIGEYLDETTGHWLMGDRERSRYYNHSTFCDLVITGIVGLRPRPDRTLEVRPLLPEGEWDWFCLDNVRYHNRNITIVWDRRGDHFHQGRGLRVLVDGKLVGHADKLCRLVCHDVL